MHDTLESMFKCLQIRAVMGGRASLQVELTVINFTALGAHASSCLSEHGQSKLSKKEAFARAPSSADASEWASMPVAFIRVGWECFNGLAMCAHACFCFDKSKNNFAIQKFKRASGSLICPHQELAGNLATS